MIVGGEFYEDDRWLTDERMLSTAGMTFLNGGKACLLLIGDYLLDHGIKSILLPSYLCPDIVTTLEQCGLNCAYYQIRPDFSIDLQDLTEKVGLHQAVYFIHYFGFLPAPAVRDTLLNLRQKGVLVVEDNAQAGFTAQPMGDFIFNSIRKLAPYDGGYLSTPLNITPYIQKYHGIPNRRLPLIRAYRKGLAEYLYQGTDSYDELVSLYTLTEEVYASDSVVEGDILEREQIEHLDWPGIKQRRRENYAYLLNLLMEIPELQPIFSVLQEEIMPLGLPVYVNRGLRDELHDYLGEAGIGLTIHWHQLLTDPRLNGNPVAVDMASRILTLVIDQRTSHKQMDRMVQTIMSWLNKRKK
jgi:dTDP-4-amino-4,6-dideoxygalactose transaminase